MQIRKLGNTGLELSVIGLGTWALGGPGWQFAWGPQDDRDSIAAIRRALDLGINWIDTAPVYGLGHAEEITGQALSGLSQKPLIATKCSRLPGPNGQIVSSLAPDSLRREVEASLKRLRVDVIDLYQIHWPRPEAEIERAWETLAALKAEGKVRQIGVCNFNQAQLERILPIHPVASLQPPYSLLEREAEALFDFCARNGIGIVAYSPLQKGLLTDKLTRDWVAGLPEGDHRRADPRFSEPALSATLTLVQGLRQVAAQNGRTTAQLALAWALRRPEVTSVIVGARRPSQIEETFQAGDWTLTAGEVEAVEALWQSWRRAAA